MAGIVPSGVQVPRIVPLLATLAILAYVNRAAPRILPAIFALLVLYAAVTNVPRAQALLGGFDDAVARLIHPSSPPGPRRS